MKKTTTSVRALASVAIFLAIATLFGCATPAAQNPVPAIEVEAGFVPTTATPGNPEALAARQPEVIGTWLGNTYTNIWMNITFEKPDDHTTLTHEEINMKLHLMDEDSVSAFELTTHSDFWIRNSSRTELDFSFADVSDSELDAEALLKMRMEAIAQKNINTNPVTLVEITTMNIGGKEYVVGELSYNSPRTEKWYVNIDDGIVTWICLALNELERDAAAALVDSLTTID